ncbi:MAG: hypothetical protein A2W00_10730 [Candidatus Eisenbacteria bacterium RBG_16_71_46]|nr:MAG: hypothetical protein A2W00_10730 [Candidatus Eisenbacteria bacterium RBG_16_71_46]
MATIKDVARDAGVSIATVSRVFNESAAVSSQTRRQVREVATRLNYWPNGVARSLITNRTHAVGVLLPDLHGEFFSEIIRGIDLAARKENLHLLVSSSHSDTRDLLSALRAMRGRIDGLIVMAPDADAPAAIRAGAAHTPLVLIDPAATGDDLDAICIANLDGAAVMIRHLLGLGHRRIAVITGPPRNSDAQQRLEGYRAALRDAGVAPDPELEIPGDFSERSGHDAGARLLALARRPTAVFAANDSMAVGLLGALGEAGVRVPEDIAVTGFDDIALARHLTPPLTTVHVDAFRLGERAVHHLLARQGSPQGGSRPCEILPTTLVVRRSCGSPMADGARGRGGRTQGG